MYVGEFVWQPHTNHCSNFHKTWVVNYLLYDNFLYLLYQLFVEWNKKKFVKKNKGKWHIV